MEKKKKKKSQAVDCYDGLIKRIEKETVVEEGQTVIKTKVVLQDGREIQWGQRG